MSQPNDPDRPDQTQSAPGGAPVPPQYPTGGQQQPPAPDQGQYPQYPAGGGQQPPGPEQGYPQYPAGGGEQQPPPPGQAQYPQFPAGAGDPAAGYQYSAQPGFYYDPQSELELPNGTELTPNGRRFGAYLLDILLAIVTLGIGYLIWSLIIWSRGQTPAKQLLHMRCYRVVDRRHATWGWMAMRQFVGGIVEGIIPAGIIISGVMVMATKDHKAIHDHLAGTVVLNDPQDVLRIS